VDIYKIDKNWRGKYFV